MKPRGLALAMATWAVVLMGCAQEGAQQAQMEMSAGDMAAVVSAVAEVRGAWEVGWEAGDAAMVAGLYASDAIYMPPNAEAVRGSGAIEQRMSESIMELVDRDVTITGTEHSMSGDLVYEIGSYTQTAEVMGAPYEDVGKYLVVLKRQADGSWKIQAHIYNSDLPLMMEAAEMMEGEM